MAKQSKIEQYGCQEIVASGIRQDRSYREIAKDCSEWAGVPISHTAVQRYIESLQEKKKEVIVQSEHRVAAVVQQDFDIIQTTLTMAQKLVSRFEFIDNLPDHFEERMQELEHRLVDMGVDAEYLANWSQLMNTELRRKVTELTSLSKETREYMKFMVHMREKAFEFELMQEFMALFMRCFHEESKDGAYERAVQRVSSNPRMLKILEQQFPDASGGGVDRFEMIKDQADLNMQDEAGEKRERIIGDIRESLAATRKAARLESNGSGIGGSAGTSSPITH